MKVVFQTHNIFVINYLKNLLQRQGIDTSISDQDDDTEAETHGFHRLFVDENFYSKALPLLKKHAPSAA